MAIMDTHKKFIRDSVGHLLEFSSEVTEFQAQIIQLKQALLLKSDEKNDFHHLGLCLHQPTEYFKTLEKQHPIFTEVEEGGKKVMKVTGYIVPKIDEIQAYLMQYIEDCLTAVMEKLVTEETLELAQLGWRTNDIVIQRSEEEVDTLFQSAVAPDENRDAPLTLPGWTLPSIPGAIYSQTLRLDEKKTRLQNERNEEDENEEDETEVVEVIKRTWIVDVQAQFPNGDTYSESVRVYRMPDGFRDDDAETRFLDKLQIDAQDKGRRAIAEQAIDYYMGIEGYIVDEEIEVEARRFKSANMIVTNQYYFQRLLEGSLSLEQTLGYSVEEAVNMTDPLIIELIKAGVCDFKDNPLFTKNAAKLTPQERAVATHPTYHTLLWHQKMTLDEIDGISVARARFLSLSPIAHYIQLEKMTVRQARRLPREFESLLLSDEYSRYFEDHGVDWEAMGQLTSQHCETLMRYNIMHLVTHGVLDIVQVTELSPQFVELLTNHASLVHLLEMRFKQPEITEDSKENQFVDLHLIIFGARLNAIRIGMPYFLHQQNDSIKQIMEEITTIAYAFDIQPSYLHEQVLGEFLLNLQQDLEEKMETDEEQAKIYSKFMSITGDCEHKDLPIVMDELIALAQQTHKEASRINYMSLTRDTPSCISDDSLFSKKRKKVNHPGKKESPKRAREEDQSSSKEVRTFCKQLIDMSEAAHLVEQRQERRSGLN